MNSLSTLSGVFNNALVLYCFGLAIWGGLLFLRNQSVSGGYLGALWLGAGMGVISVVFWLLRVLSGEPLRWVYLLYCLYFIIVFPGTFAMLRGRDDRTAALIFSGVALFTGLAAIAAADPTRGVILPTPTLLPTLTPGR